MANFKRHSENKPSDEGEDLSSDLYEGMDEENRCRSFFDYGDTPEANFRWPVGDGYYANLFRSIYGKSFDDYGVALDLGAFSSLIESHTAMEIQKAIIAPTVDKGGLPSGQYLDAKYWMSGAEANNLAEGVAAANSVHGLLFNTMVTISYKYAGILNESEAVPVLTQFLHRMGKRYMGKRFPSEALGVPIDPSTFAFCYVHERSKQHGLHVHILTYLPKGHQHRLQRWANKALASIVGKPIPDNTVMVSSKASNNPNRQIQDQARMVRYILKGIDEGLTIESPMGSGIVVSGYDFFDIRHNHRHNQGRIEGIKRVGLSRNISIGARKKAGFVSAFEAGDDDHIFAGVEWQQYRDRCQLEEKWDELEKMIP